MHHNGASFNFKPHSFAYKFPAQQIGHLLHCTINALTLYGYNLQSVDVNKITAVCKPVAMIGFVIGVLASTGVLSGDDQGRVNLLYLLLVFLVVPLAGAVLSLVSLLSRKGLNAARVLTYIPLWSQAHKNQFYFLEQNRLDKFWLFTQSQAAAIAYAFAALLTFGAMLVVTDINFVWRSTLLAPEQLYPLLTAISVPWWFWDSAQPSLALLQSTQDTRLTTSYSNPNQYGQWWAFVLAVQIVYGFALRGLLFSLGLLLLKGQLNKLKAQQTLHPHTQPSSAVIKAPPKTENPIVTQLPDKFIVGNWAKLASSQLVSLPIEKPIEQQEVLAVGPESSLANTPLDSPLVLILKSWEPPLGELADFMADHHGYLLPVDLQSDVLRAPQQVHLAEWRRFVSEQSNWQLYQPRQWLSTGSNL